MEDSTRARNFECKNSKISLFSRVHLLWKHCLAPTPLWFGGLSSRVGTFYPKVWSDVLVMAQPQKFGDIIGRGRWGQLLQPAAPRLSWSGRSWIWRMLLGERISLNHLSPHGCHGYQWFLVFGTWEKMSLHGVVCLWHASSNKVPLRGMVKSHFGVIFRWI